MSFITYIVVYKYMEFSIVLSVYIVLYILYILTYFQYILSVYNSTFRMHVMIVCIYTYIY